MGLAASTVVGTRRPVAVRITTLLLFFLGLTAAAGGVALVTGDVGVMAPPIEWLEPIPLIDSWVVPGLVLGIGFGAGSLLTGYGVLKRPLWSWARIIEHGTGHHWSWSATILIGLAQVVWITLELIFLPELSILQAIYGPVGLALSLLPLTTSVSSYLQPG